ncbi:MAG: hypothetical protein IJ874_01415 [Ruminococcus sp.]|nr:hypothetical protein [Ruminococcus sp.]
MKNIKKLAAAVSALCLAASTSCSASIGKGTQTALTAGGYDVPAGVFIYYTISEYDSAVSLLSEQNEDTPTLKDVKNSTIDGLDASDWIQDKATDECITYAAVQKNFDEIDGQLTDEEYDEIDEMAEYYYSIDSRNELNGVSLDSIRRICEASYKQRAVFMHYYGIDSEKGCSEEELKDYFDENYARVKYFTVSLNDDEGNPLDEDGQRERRKLAESYAKQINKKSDDLEKMWELDSASEEYNEYLAAQTTAAEDTETEDTTTTAAADAEDEATETTETTTTDPYANERLYQRTTTTTASDDITVDTETTAEEEESDYTKSYNALNNYIFNELPLNEAQVYEYDDSTLYVIIRGDLRERMTEDDYWTEDYINQLIQTRYYEDYTKYLEDYSSTVTADKNSSAYRRYAPFKLVLESE